MRFSDLSRHISSGLLVLAGCAENFFVQLYDIIMALRGSLFVTQQLTRFLPISQCSQNNYSTLPKVRFILNQNCLVSFIYFFVSAKKVLLKQKLCYNNFSLIPFSQTNWIRGREVIFCVVFENLYLAQSAFSHN